MKFPYPYSSINSSAADNKIINASALMPDDSIYGPPKNNPNKPPKIENIHLFLNNAEIPPMKAKIRKKSMRGLHINFTCVVVLKSMANMILRQTDNISNKPPVKLFHFGFSLAILISRSCLEYILSSSLSEPFASFCEPNLPTPLALR